MSTVIDSLESAQLRRAPAFDAGDRVRVHFQVVEGTRRRTQVFEGVVIRRQGHGVRETFTARKQSFGVGVERTFPLHSPKIDRIEIAARGDVRRAKLYYLRGRVGKRARVRERRNVAPEEAVERALLYGAAAEQGVEGGEAVADEPLEVAEGPEAATHQEPEGAEEASLEAPEPAVEAPEPADEAPEPADEAPEPADEAPERAEEASGDEEQPDPTPEAEADPEAAASETSHEPE